MVPAINKESKTNLFKVRLPTPDSKSAAREIHKAAGLLKGPDTHVFTRSESSALLLAEAIDWRDPMWCRTSEQVGQSELAAGWRHASHRRNRGNVWDVPCLAHYGEAWKSCARLDTWTASFEAFAATAFQLANSTFPEAKVNASGGGARTDYIRRQQQ